MIYVLTRGPYVDAVKVARAHGLLPEFVRTAGPDTVVRVPSEDWILVLDWFTGPSEDLAPGAPIFYSLKDDRPDVLYQWFKDAARARVRSKRCGGR